MATLAVSPEVHSLTSRLDSRARDLDSESRDIKELSSRLRTHPGSRYIKQGTSEYQDVVGCPWPEEIISLIAWWSDFQYRAFIEYFEGQIPDAAEKAIPDQCLAAFNGLMAAFGPAIALVYHVEHDE